MLALDEHIINIYMLMMCSPAIIDACLTLTIEQQSLPLFHDV